MEDWIRTDKIQGVGPGSIEVEVDPNPSETERRTVLNVIRRGEVKEINIFQEGAEQVIVIPQFDYLVFRYTWPESSGKDYDSATGFINTGIPGVDGQLVGWSYQWAHTHMEIGDFLTYGGDNTSSGAEAALIEMNKLLANSQLDPSQRDIRLKVYGNWYNSAAMGTGLVTISFSAYLGGTMIKNGTNFVNINGQTVYEGSAVAQVLNNGQDNNQDIPNLYKDVATMFYNKDTRDCFIQIT